MTGTLLPEQFSDFEPYAPTWCLATERERFAQRMASTMDEMQAFYDAFFPGPKRPSRTARSSRSTTCPPTPNDCCSCCTRSSWRRSRWKRGASRTSPIPAPRTSTC